MKLIGMILATCVAFMMPWNEKLDDLADIAEGHHSNW